MVDSFAWGLRIKTNNEAEWLDILHGFELISKPDIKKIAI